MIYDIPSKMTRSELTEYKKNLVLTEIQHECIIGTLLGDASIADPLYATRNPGIKWEQALKNQQYIDSIYQLMKPWVGSAPLIRDIRGGGAKDRQSIWFKTYRHSSFRFYEQEFYCYDADMGGKRRKKIPELIHRWLTPRILAYWFMDDGGKVPYGYMLNTQCYPLHEQRRLISALSSCYQLEVSIHKDKDRYRLYIQKRSQQKFTDLISPYIVPCLSYKLHSEKSEHL